MIESLKEFLKKHEAELIRLEIDDPNYGCAYDALSDLILRMESSESGQLEFAPLDPKREWGTWNKVSLGVK